MRNCNSALPPLLFSIALFFLPFSLVSSIASAKDPLVQTSSSQVFRFTADFMSTVILHNQDKAVMNGRIYSSPPLVRFEPHPEEGIGSYNEILLYDFERQKVRRVFLGDKIYFEDELTERNRLKAMQEGWIPWRDLPNTQRRKIKLKEDFVNDHPCVLYLLERKLEIPTGKKPSSIARQYSLFWEATDLNNLPVRIIYFLPEKSAVVVDYKDVKLEDPDPALFTTPEGFLNLSPF